MNYDRPELASRLASEYMLGLMHGRARRRFERLMRTSPAIARAVAAWGDALVPLADAAPLAAKAPPDLWKAIEARTIAKVGRPATAAAAATTKKRSWWSDFGWMRAGGFALAGLMLGVAVPKLWLMTTPVSEEQRIAEGLPGSYVGFLAEAPGQPPSVLVGQLRQGRELGIKVVRPFTVPADARAFLWAIHPDGTFMPLGAIPSTGKGRLATTQPAEQLFGKVAELAVSIEPAGTATPERPSGAFVLRGPCVKLW